MLNFKEKLNDKQYEAVASEKRFLRIIAGAGSGKTRVLTYKIAYLIENKKINPEEILAITFTNKVANEMKERVHNLINIDTKELLIKTFHSFCTYFLRKEVYYNLGITSNFSIIDEDDQKDLIKNISKSLKYASTNKDPFISKAIKFIQKNKGLGLYPEKVEYNPNIKDFNKLLEVYKNYELTKTNLYTFDFDDLILRTIQILKSNNKTLIKWSNKYKYILIDEFQDTDNLQYEIVQLLVGNNTSLYVVGDPDQTIYTWRGANQNIILNLEHDFYPLSTIILNENYRSTKNILNKANNLISNNKQRYKKDLITNNEIGTDVVMYSGFNKEEEAEFVVSNIINLKAQEKDFSFNDVVILYRASYISNSFEKKLIASQIPFCVYGGVRFFQRLEIKYALAYFRLANNLDDDLSYLKIINVPSRKIGRQTLLHIQEEAKNNNVSIFDYIENIEKYSTKLKASIILSLQILNTFIKEANKKIIEGYEEVIGVLKTLIDNVKLIEYVNNLDEETNENNRGDNINSLFDDLYEFLKSDSENDLTLYLENIALASAQDDLVNTDKVKLMTIHTAKGLEFDYVFLVGCNKGVFPSERTLLESPIDGMEEERRLCYVAFTRAKKRLFVSCNKDYSYVSKSYGEPSIFIKEAKLNIKKSKINNYESSYLKFNTEERYKKYFNNEEFSQSIKNIIEDMNKNKQNTNYNIGDEVIHKVFGDGKIIEKNDDILSINFKNHGIKRILANHPSLSKKEY